jgi:4-hydroxy-tetrahydrodipicolinate reductase
MTALKLAVVGAGGRMGQRVVALAPEHGFSAVHPVPRGAPLASLRAGGFSVIIDFSSPEATGELANLVAETGTALVSGTTGLRDEDERALDLASKRAAVFWEPNMSFGVHVLAELVRRAALTLGPEYDVEIAETHHRMKADAPSGTAKRLVEAVLDAREGRASEPGFGAVVHGREGIRGKRPQGEIAVHALRGGDVVGDHTAYFLGPGERLELTHRATSRDVFVHGALRAAELMVNKPPGRYRMKDLVGF